MRYVEHRGVGDTAPPTPSPDYKETTTEDFLWLKQETGETLLLSLTLVSFLRDKKHSVFNDADMRDLVEGFVYVEI